MKAAVKTLDNKESGSVDLNKDIFAVEPRADVLNRVVKYQRDKKQAGTHKTKTISEISGTGKKPWKQKGTGRARAGSLRSMHHRGGATAFGPVVRDHATKLPKKIRALGLKMALSAKAQAGQLIVLDTFKPKNMKTKELRSQLTAMGIKSALFIDGAEVDADFKKAASNIPLVSALPTIGANVYDILKYEHLVLSKESIKQLEARLANV